MPEGGQEAPGGLLGRGRIKNSIRNWWEKANVLPGPRAWCPGTTYWIGMGQECSFLLEGWIEVVFRVRRIDSLGPVFFVTLAGP
jgi:hypothetical protein